MPRYIVLVLHDSEEVINDARRIALKTGKTNTEIRCFLDQNCLQGLSSREIERLNILGHAGKQNFGEFSPRKFVEQFNTALTNAGLNKTDIKKLNCLGCELGFVDEKGESLAQSLVNEFAIDGYGLQLSAFTNKGVSKSLGGTRLTINDQGNAFFYGLEQEEHGAQNETASLMLYNIRKTLLEVQKKQSLFDSLVPWETKTSREIFLLQQQSRELEIKIMALQTPIFYTENPIKLLETDKNYQFSPQFTQEALNRLNLELDSEAIKLHAYRNEVNEGIHTPEQAKQMEAEWAAYSTPKLALRDTMLKYLAPETIKITSLFRSRLIDIKLIPTQKLQTILSYLNKSPSISLSETTFNVLRDQIKDFQGDPETLARRLKIMHQLKIPLTELFGKNKLERLMRLPAEQLKSLESILSNLSTHKALNEKSFNYVLDNIKNLEGKTARIIEIFDNLKQCKIPVLEKSDSLMKLNELALNTLNDKIKKIVQFTPSLLNEKQFDILLKEAKRINPRETSAPVEKTKDSEIDRPNDPTIGP